MGIYMGDVGIQCELMHKHEKLYMDLTATFEDKKQFALLNKLLDIENEITTIENR